ncbi:MAG: lytic transglycosylase domain-containing protein, partial [Acetobacteraceae bacterium]|nr:lytic transglycosylase domain-containing protein [Acetobacteraceae bacterium]
MQAATESSEGAGRARDSLLCLAFLCTLAACSGSQRGGARNYATPGPPEDPWGPYIREAGSRFAVPETWIREVMRQESGGQQYLGGTPTTSPAGAMGLMQVMPSTYEALRQEYGLGGDPYDPHDNILAGTAYIREMYDRYGSPGFLAAYNAGPHRVDDYLLGARNLPGETRNYLAAVAPRLGGNTVYAAAAPARAAPAAAPGGRIEVADAMEPIRSPGDPGPAPAPTAASPGIAA